MLISHFRHLEQVEEVPFGRVLILRGAEERLPPILMTALVTALALLPVAVAGGRAGHEIEHPMAVVILGGLFTSMSSTCFCYLPYANDGARPRPINAPVTFASSPDYMPCLS
jgi:Cu/Ag efflux pump CusA